MINFFYYDTATGRVLATGQYDERGDGAAARALGAGQINPVTEYAPAGVKTARPLFPANMVIDKANVTANAVDTATISNVPAGTTAKVFKDGDALPRAAVVVNDGSLLFRADTAGSYQIVLSKFPNQDMAFQVTAA